MSPEYRQNILTVEDDQDIRESLKDYLSLELGIEERNIRAFGNADEVDVCLDDQDFTPDIAFINLYLGDEPKGLEIIKRMKSDSRFAKTRIVAMTADPLKSLEYECRKEGADFIPKPFDLERIKNIVMYNNDQRTENKYG